MSGVKQLKYRKTSFIITRNYKGTKIKVPFSN
jgi:hypothetical protein